MAGYYEALGLLKQARAELRRAEELIDAAVAGGDPAVIVDLVPTALRLKETAAVSNVMLEHTMKPLDA